MKLRAEITPHSGKKTPENDLFFKFFEEYFLHTKHTKL